MESLGAFVDKASRICTRGHVVRNPYTFELQYVPCGSCETCLNSKSTQNTLRVYAQTKVSRYVYFISLTFSQRFIAKYKIDKIKDLGSGLNLYCARSIARPSLYRTVSLPNGKRKKYKIRGLCMNDSFEYYFNASDSYIKEYTQKADLSCNGKYPEYLNTYSYLCRKDLSLFIKRLRKLLNKISNEKISLYTVGEYGPKSIRAHFHILLFFDEARYAENIGQFVRQAWTFGRADVSLSRGKSEEYVSSYLNATNCTPVHLRRNSSVRPFSRFSNGFGESIFENAFRDAREGNFDSLVNGTDIVINGNALKIYPWRTALDARFYGPACRRSQSWETLSSVITCVRNIFKRPAYQRKEHRKQKITPLLVTKRLYEWFKKQRPSDIKKDIPLSYLLDFLRLHNSRAFVITEKIFISRFYNLFRSTVAFLSGHGYNIYQRYINCSDLRSLLINSINFYKTRDYENLRNSFQSCESFKSFYSYIFVRQDEAINEKFRKSEVGILAAQKAHDLSVRKIKHREMNDLNKNLFYDIQDTVI